MHAFTSVEIFRIAWGYPVMAFDSVVSEIDTIVSPHTDFSIINLDNMKQVMNDAFVLSVHPDGNIITVGPKPSVVRECYYSPEAPGRTPSLLV